MELYRKELKLAVIKGLDESRGSSNVPIKLTHDTSDEYINYTEQIHIRYLFDNQVKEEILPTNDNGFYIPGKPLSHDGPIELAVHLINGDIELVTNELSFIVKNAPNGTTQVDPSEFTWQQLVDQYVNAKLETFADKADMNKFKDDVNANLSNQDKKITDLQNTTKASLDSQNTKIDNFKSEVNTSLSNQNTSINQTTSAQNSKIATLESRMNTFTSLSEGSTTGDAELKDIRVGANGVTYNTAGDAVRGQYSQLKEDLVTVTDLFIKGNKPIALSELTYFIGYLTDNGKTVVQSNNYGTFTLPKFNDDTVVTISIENNSLTYILFRACLSDTNPINTIEENRQMISIGNNKMLTITVPRNKYLCFTIGKQTVDTMDVAFSLINLSKMTYDIFTIPNAIPTNNQLNKYYEMYKVAYKNGIINIDGCDIKCSFSNKTFNNTEGLFELHNLSYKNDVIFGEDNDFIGPIKLTNGDIIGGKHGSEITDSILITDDYGELNEGNERLTKSINIFVESHIENIIKRVSIYSFNGRKLTTTSYITALNDNSFNRIWCCGIISVENSTAKHWFSKKEMTQNISGYNEMLDKCIIVCNKFNLITNMLWIESPVGIKGKEFIEYGNRKKYYNYNIYGSQDVTAGTVFSSCNELYFN